MMQNSEIHFNVRHPNLRMQLGLSDTPLTSALEEGDFDTAEKLIVDNAEPDYLDEGPFDRIPLAIVLNGDPVYRQYPRNLHLAKMLVERGADPNLRIPLAQLQRASPSPMEYLVELYKDTVKLCKVDEPLDALAKSVKFGHLFETIGLRKEEGLLPIELKEQVSELLDVFLAYGADPNVVSTSSHSTVYHTVLRNPDPYMDLVMKLCEAGGDLNRCNAHRTTPLMDLVIYAELDAAMDVLTRIWEVNPDISSLKKQNCCEHTALWRAMLSGSPRVAMELLKRGADPSPRAMVAQGCWYRGSRYIRSYNSDLETWTVSALFAPLLGNSAPYILFASIDDTLRDNLPEDGYEFNIDLFNKVMSCAVCPIIDGTDNSYFSDNFPDLLLELENILGAETKFSVLQLESQVLKLEDISILMFGKLKAGLQQLCVRQIMQQMLRVENADKIHQIAKEVKSDTNDQEENVVEENTIIYGCKIESSLDQWKLVQDITPAVIRYIVTEQLKLPSLLVKRFEIEAARLQLGASLYTLETVDCFQGCDGESDEGSIDPSYDSNLDNEDDDDNFSSWLSESTQNDFDSIDCKIRTLNGWVTRVDMDLCSSDSSDEMTSSDEQDNSSHKDVDDECDSNSLHKDVHEAYDDDGHDNDSSPGKNVDDAEKDELVSGDKHDADTAEKDELMSGGRHGNFPGKDLGDMHNSCPCKYVDDAKKGGLVPGDKLDSSSKKNVPVSEDTSSSSGESIPHDICRDEYEPFSDDIFCSDVSPMTVTDNTGEPEKL